MPTEHRRRPAGPRGGRDPRPPRSHPAAGTIAPLEAAQPRAGAELSARELGVCAGRGRSHPSHRRLCHAPLTGRAGVFVTRWRRPRTQREGAEASEGLGLPPPRAPSPPRARPPAPGFDLPHAARTPARARNPRSRPDLPTPSRARRAGAWRALRVGRGCCGAAPGRSGAAARRHRGSGGAPGAGLDAPGLRLPALPAVQGRQSWAPRPLRRRSGCLPRPRSPSAATRRCFCSSPSLCPGAARPTSPRVAAAAAAGTVPAAKARASTAQVGPAGARPAAPPSAAALLSPRPGWPRPLRAGPGRRGSRVRDG